MNSTSKENRKKWKSVRATDKITRRRVYKRAPGVRGARRELDKFNMVTRASHASVATKAEINAKMMHSFVVVYYVISVLLCMRETCFFLFLFSTGFVGRHDLSFFLCFLFAVFYHTSWSCTDQNNSA